MAYTLLPDDTPPPSKGRYTLLPDEAASAPSALDIILNAANKGIAGVPDALLNTPNRLLNLGKAAFGTAATAAGRSDLAPDITPDREYAGALLRKLGAIRQSAEPTTAGGKVLDATIQGLMGAAINPASGVRQLATNMASGAGMGLAGGAVEQATGSPEWGMLAGMAAPAAAVGAARLGRMAVPNGNAAATILAQAHGGGDAARAALIEQLRNAETLVPGSAPMMQQVTDSPGIAQLARTVKNVVPGGGELTMREQAQNTARIDALAGIAPGALGVTSIEAAQTAGNDIMGRATPMRNASSAGVSAKYESIDPLGDARLVLPLTQIEATHAKYFGPGAGAPANGLGALVDDLRTLSGKPVAGQVGPDATIPLDVFNRLRSRASEIAYTAGQGGNRQEAAAAQQIKAQLDATLEAAAGRAAMRQVLETGQDAPAAMWRRDLGEIDFVKGEPGRGHGGKGVDHLVRLRNEDGYDGLMAAMAMPEILARGVIGEPYSVRGSLPRVNVNLGPEARAVLEQAGANKWLLTGWDHTLRGGGTGVTPEAVYAGRQPFIQTDQGARNSDTRSIGQPGEYFTPGMARNAREAKQAKIEHESRFGTGPAAKLWRDGTDGAPQLQGAEVARAFFHSGASQAPDIAQFRRMVADDPAALEVLRKSAVADLAEYATSNGTGLLSTDKFGRWLDARGEAVKGLLSADQQQVLGSIRADLERAARAEALGRATGSNTAQNLEGGLLFARPLDWAARAIPVLGRDGLEYLRNQQKLRQARAVQGLLLDPQAAAEALSPQAPPPMAFPPVLPGPLMQFGNRGLLTQ